MSLCPSFPLCIRFLTVANNSYHRPCHVSPSRIITVVGPRSRCPKSTTETSFRVPYVTRVATVSNRFAPCATSETWADVITEGKTRETHWTSKKFQNHVRPQFDTGGIQQTGVDRLQVPYIHLLFSPTSVTSHTTCQHHITSVHITARRSSSFIFVLFVCTARIPSKSKSFPLCLYFIPFGSPSYLDCIFQPLYVTSEY